MKEEVFNTEDVEETNDTVEIIKENIAQLAEEVNKLSREQEVKELKEEENEELGGCEVQAAENKQERESLVIKVSADEAQDDLTIEEVQGQSQPEDKKEIETPIEDSLLTDVSVEKQNQEATLEHEIENLLNEDATQEKKIIELNEEKSEETITNGGLSNGATEISEPVSPSSPTGTNSFTKMKNQKKRNQKLIFYSS